MKKVTLILALAATLFAACGKNDDLTTNTPEEPVQQVPAIVSMMYYLNATDDMLQYLDYTVTYNDGTDERQESVVSNRWEKTLVAALPATFTIKTRIRVKEGMYDALAAVDTVHFTRGHGYAYQVFDSTATAIPGMSEIYDAPSSTVGPGARIAERCEAGDFDKTYTLSFDAYGVRIEN